MRILYVGNAQGFGNADRFYMIPQKLINGFTRLGHTVYVFNDRDYSRYSNIFRSQKWGVKSMNEKLLDICRDYQPELIVLGHCKNVTNETLEEARILSPGLKIVYRNVDPLHEENNVRDIKQRVGVADGIFITTAGDVLAQFSHPKSLVAFMPNPVDIALETQRAYANPNADIDLVFLASFLRHQTDLRKVTAEYLLSNKGELNIYVGGAGINNNKVYGAKFYELLARSKMGLSLNKVNDFYLYASDRMSQYMASGVLSFVPRDSRFEDIFGDDSFVSFTGKEELCDKVSFFAKNNQERIRIASNGHKKIHDYFKAEKVCQYIIDQVFHTKLSYDYRWPTESY